MNRGVTIALLGTMALAAAAGPARAQTTPPVPAGVAADTLRLDAEALIGAGGVDWRPLSGGERIATWVVGRVEVGNPAATGRPVPDAPPGAVVASFGGGRPFAWPDGKVVWTAPRAGRLTFGLNALPEHALGGAARIVVVALGTQGSEGQRAFPAPAIDLERAAGGALARYSDRAGFGVAPSTLRLTVTTNRGVTYHLSSWARPGERETFLPLPPPGIDLPPGVHRLYATVLDHMGNAAPAAEISFEAP
jgi:hypothetical protein